MNKDTIGAWGMGVAAVMGIIAFLALILTWARQSPLAEPEEVVEVRLPRNPSAIAAHVCKDRRALSGWDGDCLMLIDRMVRGRRAQVDGNYIMSRDTCLAWLDMARRSYAVDAAQHKELVCGR